MAISSGGTWSKGSKIPGSLSSFLKTAGISLIPFLFIVTLGAGSLKEGKGEMEVTGKVYVMGNEPFSQAAIQMDDGQVYALVGVHEKELRRHQGRRVSVTGRPSVEKPRGSKAIEVKSFRVLEEKR